MKEYSYDGFGNRISIKETSGGQTATVDAQYNLANQLTRFGSEALSYDLNGNRTEDGRYQYTWNSRDQLTAVTKKGESQPFATYKYNEDGKRIQKTVNGTVTNYFYDGDSLNVLYETNGSNQVVRSYTYSEGGQLLSMKKGSSQYFYHYNARGDVIALTDAQSNVVASYEYDAWGKVLKEVEQDSVKDNPYRYAGYQYDKETGMYYLIARYYEPKHGVFLSIDPESGMDDDLLSQNGYNYAHNNPIKYFDSDGRQAKQVTGSGGGGAFQVRTPRSVPSNKNSGIKNSIPSKKSILKKVFLPTKGKIRYVPPSNWSPSQPLPKIKGGYKDKFGNIWVKGPSRTKGQSFEWDVQLSKTGKKSLGHLSRDGKHLNVSLDGKITHR